MTNNVLNIRQLTATLISAMRLIGFSLYNFCEILSSLIDHIYNVKRKFQSYFMYRK